MDFSAGNPLYFRPDGTFTVIQFADLHYGESVDQDKSSSRVMYNILQTEQQIDLAVFTGDQVSGYLYWNNDDILPLWIESLMPVVNHSIPFATIFGNHDDQPFHFEPATCQAWVENILILLSAAAVAMYFIDNKRLTRSNISMALAFIAMLMLILYQVNPSTQVRESILRHEKSQFPELSHTQVGPPSIPGTSNFYLPVRSKTNRVLLFFLDSGGGRLPQTISQSQIEWVKSVSSRHGNPNAIAFFHIPSRDFGYVDEFECKGKNETEFPTSFNSDTKDLASAGVKAIFVGHDHRNSWCCVSTSSIPSLCYGRHTGYGGYGDWMRGARIIRLKFDNDSTFTITTWLRMENGGQEIQGQIFP
jgi:hypothetical protein